MLAELAAVPLEERSEDPGLHPDRAPTIVAGAAILLESMLLFGLDSVEVSEADILHGAALDLAARKLGLKRNRLPKGGGSKVAPSGRAGVRAMKGPLRFRRREAPIRCGFARTYVPGLVRRHDWPDPVRPQYPGLVPISHRTYG